MACATRQIFSKFLQFSRLNSANFNRNAPAVSSLTNFSKKWYSNAPTPYEIVDENLKSNATKEVINKINAQVSKSEEGRLFAVVHVQGKQYKITEGDVIVIEGYWPPDCGDKISLDKVLLVGAEDFTLFGTPLVQKGLVNVEATVIEKTVTHTKTNFKKKRRKQYMRIHFFRIPQTMLRINTVRLVGELNNPPAVSGLEHAVF